MLFLGEFLHQLDCNLITERIADDHSHLGGRGANMSLVKVLLVEDAGDVVEFAILFSDTFHPFQVELIDGLGVVEVHGFLT